MRDVQMHPFKQQVLHIDFQRVRQDQKIHVKVPLHFINADIAPGVKLSGGMISHVVTEIEISCLPKDLPESIVVDLSEMTAGSTIHTSDLKLPENVEIPALLRGDNQPISILIVPRGEILLKNPAKNPPDPVSFLFARQRMFLWRSSSYSVIHIFYSIVCHWGCIKLWSYP